MALKVAVLEHVAVGVVHGVQDDEVEVHLVGPVAVLGHQRVGAGVIHLSNDSN